jgi:insertion element IS1 protein InsB
MSNCPQGIFYTAELDEFWSFAGNKNRQRWTWYAMDRASGIILAWHNGGRTDADFLQLQSCLAQIPIDFYFPDNWGLILNIFHAKSIISEKPKLGRLNVKILISEHILKD